MTKSIEQIAKDFSTHKFDDLYDYIADNVVWDNVGGTKLTGKAKVIKSCEQSKKYLARVTTNFTKVCTVVAKSSVVVESAATYLEKNGDLSAVASCDVYDFENGKMVSLTSYNLDMPVSK